MGSGRRARTKELYNAIVAGYRVAGQNHTEAAKLAGVGRDAARLCFNEGWEGIGPAVREVLLQDQLIVRAARAGADPSGAVEEVRNLVATQLEASREGAKDAVDMLERAAKRTQELQAQVQKTLDDAQRRLEEVEGLARSKADELEVAQKAGLARVELEAKQRLAELLQKSKVDAAETMADEANAAKFGRKAALGAAAIAALVLKDAQGIASQLRTALGDLSKLTPVQAVRIAREMIRLVESSEKAVILALQAERLRVGQPTEVFGVAGFDTTLEEKQIKVKAVARALERQRLKVVPPPADAAPATGKAS